MISSIKIFDRLRYTDICCEVQGNLANVSTQHTLFTSLEAFSTYVRSLNLKISVWWSLLPLIGITTALFISWLFVKYIWSSSSFSKLMKFDLLIVLNWWFDSAFLIRSLLSEYNLRMQNYYRVYRKIQID